MGRGDGTQQRSASAPRREPGTKVTDEQREERVVDGFKFELTTTEWNDTDRISVDVHVDLDGEQVHLTEMESLDEIPSDDELRELVAEHLAAQQLGQPAAATDGATIQAQLSDDHRGLLADGWSSDDADSWLPSISEELGLELVVLWEEFDEWGGNGHSNLYVRSDEGLREIPDKLWAFLVDGEGDGRIEPTPGDVEFEPSQFESVGRANAVQS